MKFNINLSRENLKLMLLFFLILVIVILLYIIFNSNIENFETKDCSDCKVNPESGNCIGINDFSYNASLIINPSTQYDIPMDNLISIKDYNYKFCPWEENCSNDVNFIDNIISQVDRLRLSNTELKQKAINNIQCCSGSQFYNNNTYELSNNYLFNNYDNSCSDLFSNVNEISNSNRNLYLNILSSGTYKKIQNICRYTDISNYSDENKMGLFFKQNLSGEILFFQQNNLSPREILDRLQITSLKNMTNDLTLSTAFNEDMTFLNNNSNKNLNQFTQTELQKLNIIKNNITNNYITSPSDTIISSYNYMLLDNSFNIMNSQATAISETGNDQYLILPDQFINCTGVINDICNQTYEDISQEFITKFTGDNMYKYMRPSSDASYTTQQDSMPVNYGPSMDIAMELKSLETVQQGGLAPTNVINQYLTAINGFYENQIKTLLAPKNHSYDSKLVFQNNGTLERDNTFFVYKGENSTNDYSFNMPPTQDASFGWYGPSALYSPLKF